MGPPAFAMGSPLLIKPLLWALQFAKFARVWQTIANSGKVTETASLPEFAKGCLNKLWQSLLLEQTLEN
jgi:hypothetical protein